MVRPFVQFIPLIAAVVAGGAAVHSSKSGKKAARTIAQAQREETAAIERIETAKLAAAKKAPTVGGNLLGGNWLVYGGIGLAVLAAVVLLKR